MSVDPSVVFARFASGWKARGPAETEAAGAALASIVPTNTTLALHGDLGAGKTTFVRGLARGFGITAHVLSPTFNYLLIYDGARRLVHLDAYRIERPRDAASLMVDEFLESPWCLAIEWPENLGDRLPAGAWHLDFSSPDEATRVITLRLPPSAPTLQ